MHDIRFIREHPAAFDAGLRQRGAPAQSDMLLALDDMRRQKILESETALADRNIASKNVGKAKAAGDEAEFVRLRNLVARKKQEISDLQIQAKAQEDALRTALMEIPNIPLSDVPEGQSEDDNIEVSRWGEPRTFDSQPKDHHALGEALGLLDFQMAAKLSGTRFSVLSGALARMHRALGQFMLNTHTSNGMIETWTPVLVRDQALFGTGQLPKFSDDLYKTNDGQWLIPTAEVTLTNLSAGEILDKETLPHRYVALSQCFRSEAGSAGRDTRGMLRQHQFEKVEMVSITTPGQSIAELERITQSAESILQALDLPYRKMLLCSGDMGFSAQKTYDLEVWLPAQATYREISSCSLCGDFQARRMNTRCRPANEPKGKTEFVHTLNGSGLAVGRCLIAVIENYQRADGGIQIPKVLQSLMGGYSDISPDGVMVRN